MLIGIKTRRNSYLSWLVVSLTPLKNMTSSVGMIIPNIYIYTYGKIKFMVQTTSQYHTWRRTSQLGMNIETYPRHHAEMPKTQAHRHTRKREVSVLGNSSHSNTFQNKASHVPDLKFELPNLHSGGRLAIVSILDQMNPFQLCQWLYVYLSPGHFW